MIARTMFRNDIIGYFCCMDITEIFIEKRVHQRKSLISQLTINGV